MSEHEDTTRKNKKKNFDNDVNRDPLTGAPGSHPVGTGIGAVAGGTAGVAGGAAIGAATGTAAGGPVGAAVGAVAGAIAGAAGGKAIAEKVNPTEEDAYWRENHSRQSYYDPNFSYDAYEGAYRVGYQGYGRFCGTGKGYADCEAELQRDYEQNYPNAKVPWDRARPAVRAAWEHAERPLERYIGYDVVDQGDNKIGTLECLWEDQNGEPAFIGVKTGWVFGKTHVVPANQVHVGQQSRRLRLPYTEDRVKNAPAYDAESEMSYEKEQEVKNYYGIQASAEPPVIGQGKVPATQTEKRGTPEMATIQLNEEQLKVGKRQVEVGGVRLRKVIRTEVVNQPVTLQREEIVIERVPAEQAHTCRQKAFNEQEVYIPLRREEPVVQKETVLREEVRARKRSETDQQQISEEVRKEDIEVQESGQTRRRETRKDPRKPTAAESMREREEIPRSMRRHKE